MRRRELIREQSFFTVEDLARKLKISDEQAERCIKELTARGVVKLRTTNEIRDYDPINAVNARGKYQFVFVGVVVVENLATIVVFPKYLSEQDASKTAIMRQTLQAMRRASGSYSQIAAATEDGLMRNDRLALILALVESYGEYGIYSNFVRTYESNGTGAIAWSRTIATHVPVLNHGKPVYLEYETSKTSFDESDFITRLHRCVLTLCSKYLRDTELGELLDISEIDLSDSELEDFGDPATIAYRIDREMDVQFVTWKQEVLKMLRRFITDQKMPIEWDDMQCMGTSSFYNVWEKACKVAFGDLTGARLDEIGLSLKGEYATKDADTVLSIIPRPKWHAATDENGIASDEKDTLIPDIVTMAISPGGKHIFAILDAKYYTPVLKGKPDGVPGVESITKQFLYQTAYKKFVTTHIEEFDGVVNAFLVPLSGDDVVCMGYVEFPDVIAHENPPLSNAIVLWGLPAGKVFAAYLSGSKLDEDILARIMNYDTEHPVV